MNLKQMNYFLAAVDWGSFSKAAAHVRVAQPALSQQIALLEAELGIQLLTRTAQGVRVTEAGDRFYRHARTIHRQVDAAVEDMRGEASVTGTVAIGLPTSAATILALPMLSAIWKRQRAVRPVLFESLSGYLSELIARHRLDLAILFRDTPAPGIKVEPVLREDLFVISNVNSSRGDSIAMAEAAALPFVLPSRTHTLRTLVDRSFARLGIELDVIADIDSLPTMRQVAAAGIAATILPMSALSGVAEAGNLTYRRLTEPGISRCLSICRPADLPTTAASEAVEAVMASEMRRLVTEGHWTGATLCSVDDK